MSVSTQAAEAAVRNSQSVAANEQERARRGTFDDRSVEASGQAPPLRPVTASGASEGTVQTSRIGKGKRTAKKSRRGQPTVSGAAARGSKPARRSAGRDRNPMHPVGPSGDGDGRTRAARAKGREAADAGLPEAVTIKGLPAGLTAFMKDTEASLERVEKLWETFGKEARSNAEWRDLYGRFCALHRDLAMNWAQVQVNCDWEETTEAGGTPDTGVEKALQGNFDAMRARFRSLGSHPWFSLSRHIEAPLPSRPEGRLGVRSVIVPGTVIGAQMVAGYPSGGSIEGICVDRYKHVPDLAFTGVVDAKERLLFDGMLHSFVPLNELDGKRLAQLSDDELKTLISGRSHGRGGRHGSSGAHDRQVNAQLRTIRSSGGAAAAFAAELKREAGASMVAELATAVLVSGPIRRLEAQWDPGNPMRLFSIAVLGAGDVEAFEGQFECFDRYDGRTPTIFQLLPIGVSGEPLLKTVPVEIRQLAFPSSDVGYDVTTRLQRQNDNVLRWLLGPLGEPLLGGHVKEWHRNARQTLSDLESERIQSELESLRLERSEAEADRGALSLRNELTAKTIENKRTVTQVMIGVRETASRLKELWKMQADGRADDALRMHAAALAARLCYSIGYFPIISSRAGTKVAAQVDADIKLHATLANAGGGHLPSIDPGSAEWQAARAALMPQ